MGVIVTMAPVYFEFTGLPGAGKTTISKAVAHKLTGMNYKYYVNSSVSKTHIVGQVGFGRIFNKLETFYDLISSCILYKYVALNALICAIQTRPLSLVSFLRAAKLLIRLNFIKTIMRENYDLVILDQGLLQYMWSISAIDNPLPEKHFIRLLKSLVAEISLAIVLIEIDVDIAIERINNRPTMTSRFDKMPLKKTEKLLMKQQDFFKQVVNWSGDLKDIRYLVVDGNHSVKKNTNTIVNFIEQTWEAF